MPMLKIGDTVGLISCSDGRTLNSSYYIKSLENKLAELGIKVQYANTIYRVDDTPFSGTPERRAEELMIFFCNPKIKAIFDISGGDSANQILPYLNYDLISENPKPFLGISDLTVINNAIYTHTAISTYHYQISNLVGEDAKAQEELFTKLFFTDGSFNTFSYKWIRGIGMEGRVIGGNIRCFLKLAGTSHFPDSTDKIIFLESLGGGSATISSLLAQLEQMGVFKACRGILLGTFLTMETNQMSPNIEELIMQITHKYQMPIAKTQQLGHAPNSHCLPIGMDLTLF